MKLDEQVINRIAALIEKGDGVLATHRPNPANVIGFPTLETQPYAEWRTQALVCLAQVFGNDHPYAEGFASRTEDSGFTGSAQAGLGILRAAREDVELGYLQTVEQLATAEVFSDFLDQAHYLLQNGYHIPAASLAGAVLENGLRSLAERNDIAVKPRDDLSALNNKLAAKNVYNQLRRKQVGYWADVRNHADHGRFDAFTESDATDLVSGTRTFLAEYL
ncbi:MAG: hypothetical protein F4X80_03615 [Chloroflexi bacterium]|nr:hypothetical protein [Chloroflexota bacterium]